jgi:hypothetical protein
MTQRCFEFEELAVVLEQPVDDPRRRHVASCPRCRARMAEYEAFMRSEVLPGSQPEDAEQRLRAAFDASLARVPRARRASWSERAIAALSAPSARPVWAAAAVVVVAGSLFLWTRTPETPRVLRGTGSEGASGSTFGQLLAEPQPGRTMLKWSAVPGAEAYEVRLYGTNLVELQVVDAGTDTSVLVATELPPGEVVLWRVFARAGGRDLAISPVRQFEAP